ncbi:hypothetical protein DEV91_109185 [Phyllobacterium brassicacearum]|nr:hypothetical protein DEV91_109185 [Phyllobacterium brassicacearum]
MTTLACRCSKVALQRELTGIVCDYPDGRLEVIHAWITLPYRAQP